MDNHTDLVTGCYYLVTPDIYPGGYATRIKPEMIAPEHREYVGNELQRLAVLIAQCGQRDGKNKLQRELRGLLGVPE